jgi:hypothetical protein
MSASIRNKEKDRRKKGQLAVLSIFCLVYPHSQSFWKWCISHLLKIEEEEDSLEKELSVHLSTKGKKKGKRNQKCNCLACAVPIVKVIE